MSERVKINWYRCKVDRATMAQLLRKSDARAFAQVIPHLILFAATGCLAYLAYAHVHRANWPSAIPLLLGALFVHGTIGRFFWGTACHELGHKTPFRTPFWNDLFLRLICFMSWWDHVGYRLSHTRHHQVTVHGDDDGEVVLPAGLNWHGIKFFLMELTVHPPRVYGVIAYTAAAAWGRFPAKDATIGAGWLRRILTESNAAVRREHRRWAQTVLFGHLALAALFVATGHWFLIVIFTFGCHYCNGFKLACAATQHLGLASNVSDFRLCTRTYTCSWFPAFLYWNMQYHLEHHMFPAVPFYNLGRLRRVIEHDLPPATHGIWATWKEIIPVLKRQRIDQSYVFVPRLPRHEGDLVSSDSIIPIA